MTHVSDSPTDPHPRGAYTFAPTLMLLLAAVLWGSGNVANKTVLADIDPWTTVLLRCLVAAAVLAPFCLHERRQTATGRWLSSAMLPSVLFAAAIVLQQLGYQTATVTNASFLVNAACVLTPLIAFALYRETPGRATLLAAGLMFAGAFSMSGAGASLLQINPGDVLCLISALFYAVWTVALGQHAMRHGRPVATTLIHCLVAIAITFPFAMTGWPLPMPSVWNAMPEVLYLGVFSTALAFLLMVMAQARVSASVASVLVAAESLFGAAGGMLLLGERPSLPVLLGGALIVAAILVIGLAAEEPSRRPGSGQDGTRTARH